MDGGEDLKNWQSHSSLWWKLSHLRTTNSSCGFILPVKGGAHCSWSAVIPKGDWVCCLLMNHPLLCTFWNSGRRMTLRPGLLHLTTGTHTLSTQVSEWQDIAFAVNIGDFPFSFPVTVMWDYHQHSLNMCLTAFTSLSVDCGTFAKCSRGLGHTDTSSHSWFGKPPWIAGRVRW